MRGFVKILSSLCLLASEHLGLVFGCNLPAPQACEVLELPAKDLPHNWLSGILPSHLCSLLRLCVSPVYRGLEERVALPHHCTVLPARPSPLVVYPLLLKSIKFLSALTCIHHGRSLFKQASSSSIPASSWLGYVNIWLNQQISAWSPGQYVPNRSSFWFSLGFPTFLWSASWKYSGITGAAVRWAVWFNIGAIPMWIKWAHVQ